LDLNDRSVCIYPPESLSDLQLINGEYTNDKPIKAQIKLDQQNMYIVLKGDVEIGQTVIIEQKKSKK
jgi:hypothetical protein